MKTFWAWRTASYIFRLEQIKGVGDRPVMHCPTLHGSYAEMEELRVTVM
jgi:hypothetical protein